MCIREKCRILEERLYGNNQCSKYGNSDGRVDDRWAMGRAAIDGDDGCWLDQQQVGQKIQQKRKHEKILNTRTLKFC